MGFFSESPNSVMKFVTSFQICNFSESIYSVMKLVKSLMIHFVTLMVTKFPNTTYPPTLTTTPQTPSPSLTCEIIACCKERRKKNGDLTVRLTVRGGGGGSPPSLTVFICKKMTLFPLEYDSLAHES